MLRTSMLQVSGVTSKIAQDFSLQLQNIVLLNHVVCRLCLFGIFLVDLEKVVRYTSEGKAEANLERHTCFRIAVSKLPCRFSPDHMLECFCFCFCFFAYFFAFLLLRFSASPLSK